MFTILYEEAAEEDIRAFRVFEVRRIADEINAQLMKEPSNQADERAARRAGPSMGRDSPVWQLRISDFRVFYDVDEGRQAVIVRAVRRKGTKTTREIL